MLLIDEERKENMPLSAMHGSLHDALPGRVGCRTQITEAAYLFASSLCADAAVSIKTVIVQQNTRIRGKKGG